MLTDRDTRPASVSDRIHGEKAKQRRDKDRCCPEKIEAQEQPAIGHPEGIPHLKTISYRRA